MKQTQVVLTPRRGEDIVPSFHARLYEKLVMLAHELEASLHLAAGELLIFDFDYSFREQGFFVSGRVKLLSDGRVRKQSKLLRLDLGGLAEYNRMPFMASGLVEPVSRDLRLRRRSNELQAAHAP